MLTLFLLTVKRNVNVLPNVMLSSGSGLYLGLVEVKLKTSSDERD